MTIYTTSSSAIGTRITANSINSGHTILDGVALESTTDSVIIFAADDGSLTVGGYAIASGNSFAVRVAAGASNVIVNILESGHLFGGGVLTMNTGDLVDVNFINAGNVYGIHQGYLGSLGVDTIINSGFIGQSGPGATLQTINGNDQVHNSGTIQGDVDLGNNDDLYNGSGAGVVNGMVLGGSGNDTLRGSDAADNLDGGTASDLIVGRGGDDTILGDTGADTIRGGDGNDNIDGEVNNDLINGNAGDDTILGSGGDDTIRGGRDDDELRGGNGADNIRGDSGDDLIIGGTGRDDMFGGSGNDVFVFENTSDSGTGAARDRIFDFRSGEDTLDISSLAGPQFNFIGSGNFTGSGPQVRAVAAANGTLIYIDADGDGTRDSDIYLIGTSSVVEGDFLL